MKYLLSLLLLITVANIATAEVSLADDWKINGHAFVVPYLDGRDFLNETYPITFTSMKLRLEVEKTLGDISFKVALQNAKVFGDQSAVVSSNAPIFLQEGYIKLDNIFNVPLSLTAGRMKLKYNDGRFIGVSAWNNVERAFDGFKLSYKQDNMFFDVFATKHSTQYTTPIISVGPSTFPYPESPYTDYDILGFWYSNKFGDAKNSSGAHNLDLFTYWEVDSKKNNGTDKNLDRFNSGFAYQWFLNNFTAKAQMGYQYGTKGNKDVSAYLLGIYVGYKVNENWDFKLGTEMFSGTSPNETNKINTYDDYIGEKHSFLGFMDYFNTARNSYMGLGVNDYYLTANYTISPAWSVVLTPHYFLSNQESINGKNDYGMEFDLSIKYNMQKGISIEWFNGVFLPGELMKNMYQVGTKERNDPGFASYLVFNVNI